MACLLVQLIPTISSIHVSAWPLCQYLFGPWLTRSSSLISLRLLAVSTGCIFRMYVSSVMIRGASADRLFVETRVLYSSVDWDPTTTQTHRQALSAQCLRDQTLQSMTEICQITHIERATRLLAHVREYYSSSTSSSNFYSQHQTCR